MKKFIFPTLFIFSFFALVTGCQTQTPEEKRQEELEDNIKDLAKSAGKLINSLGDNADASAENLGAKAEDLIEKFGNNFKGNISEAIDEISSQIDGIAKDEDGNAKLEPASNFRTLKKGLPEKFDGFERTTAKGSTKGIMNMKVSTVKATYEKGDSKIKLTLVDGGSITKIVSGAKLNIDIDEESDNGFQRSTEFNGDKAFESCEGKNCTFTVLLNKKYLLTLDGKNVNIDNLHQLASSIQL